MWCIWTLPPQSYVFFSNILAWRIIPFSKWFVTTVYKPIRPIGRGTTQSLRDLLSMVIHHLQLMGSSSICLAQMLLRHPQNAALKKSSDFWMGSSLFLHQNGDADSFGDFVQRILQPQRSLYWHQAQTMNDCKFVREKSTPPTFPYI